MRKKWFPLVFLSFIFLPLVAQADFRLSEWRYVKKIFGKPPKAQGYLKVLLDGEVFAQAKKDLSDLRVIEGKGREVPFQIVVSTPKVEETPYSPKMFNLSFVPGSHSLFYLDLGEEGKLHNRLSLEVPEVNFRRRVEIEGSSNLKEWSRLKEGYIFDFHEEDYQARHLSLSYPESTSRYLKVTIINDKEKPLTVQRAQVFRYLKEEAEKKEIKVKIERKRENPRLKANEIYLDLTYPYPSNYLEISSPSLNYHRKVKVAGRNSKKASWVYLGEGFIFNYQTEKFSGTENSLRFREGNYRYLKVNILNYDNEPLKVLGVKVEGTPRRLLFPFQPRASYRLYYGNSKATAPRYDLAKIFPYLETKSLPQLNLLKERPNPHFVPPVVKRPWTEKNPWLLWGIMGFALLVLGFLIIRLMRAK